MAWGAVRGAMSSFPHVSCHLSVMTNKFSQTFQILKYKRRANRHGSLIIDHRQRDIFPAVPSVWRVMGSHVGTNNAPRLRIVVRHEIA